MNKRTIWILIVSVVILVAAVSVVLITHAAEEETAFVGTVVSVSDAAMVLECDTQQFDTVWVSLRECPDATPQVGDTYRVDYNGVVMETYPPQIIADSVTLLYSPQSDPTAGESDDMVLSFTGRVTEIDGTLLLMECYDKSKFDTVWVNVATTDIPVQVGEEYVVTYEDMMMPSLPPQITAVTLTKVTS